MTCGFEFDHNRNLIRLWGRETLDLSQILDILKAVHAHDAFDGRYATLCDLRELAHWALQPEDLATMVDELKAWDRRQGRTAIVVGENRAHLNLGETFAKLAEGALNGPHRVFQDHVEAEVWLGLRDVIKGLV